MKISYPGLRAAELKHLPNSGVRYGTARADPEGVQVRRLWMLGALPPITIKSSTGLVAKRDSTLPTALAYHVDDVVHIKIDIAEFQSSHLTAVLPRAAEGGVALCRLVSYRALHLSCCVWRKEQVVAVLVIFRSQGDPGDLLALYDRTVADATALSPVRPEAHYCVPTDSGIMIVDVWASRSDLQRAITENQDFQAKWSAAGLPAETVEVFELHSSGWPV